MVHFFDHEAGHILFDDMSTVDPALRHGGQTCKNFLNVLMDIRQELLFVQLFRGSAPNRRRYYERNQARIQQRIDDSPSVADKILVAGICESAGVQVHLDPLTTDGLRVFRPYVAVAVAMGDREVPTREAAAQCRSELLPLALRAYDALKAWYDSV